MRSGLDASLLATRVRDSAYAAALGAHGQDRAQFLVELTRYLGYDLLTPSYPVFPPAKRRAQNSGNTHTTDDQANDGVAQQEEEEVKLPWGRGLSTYSKFVMDIVPGKLEQAGPMGLDAEYELRFGVAEESVSLGTRAASARYIRAVTAAAQPLSRENESAAEVTNDWAPAAAATAAAIKSTVAVLRMVDSVEDSQSTIEVPASDDGGSCSAEQATARRVFDPLWRLERRALASAVRRAQADLTLLTWQRQSGLATAAAAAVGAALAAGRTPPAWAVGGGALLDPALDGWLQRTTAAAATLRERCVGGGADDDGGARLAGTTNTGATHRLSTLAFPSALLHAYRRWWCARRRLPLHRCDLAVAEAATSPTGDATGDAGGERSPSTTSATAVPAVAGAVVEVALTVVGLHAFGAAWDSTARVLGDLRDGGMTPLSPLPPLTLKAGERLPAGPNEVLVELPLHRAHLGAANATQGVAPPPASLRLRSRREQEVWERRGVALYCGTYDAP